MQGKVSSSPDITQFSVPDWELPGNFRMKSEDCRIWGGEGWPHPDMLSLRPSSKAEGQIPVSVITGWDLSNNSGGSPVPTLGLATLGLAAIIG